MFGFAAVAEFVHDFETAFDRVRKGGGGASPALIALALDAKDHVQHLIFGPETLPGRGDAILSALRAALDHLPDAAPPPAVPDAEAASSAGRWRIRFKLPPDALAHGANPALLIEELLAIGPGTIRALTGDVPPLDLFDPELCYLGWEAEIEAKDPRAAVDDVFLFMSDGMELAVEPIQAETVVLATPVAEPRIAAGAPERKAAASSLRVPAERLDALMDQVGELVIAQTRLSQMAARNRDPALVAMAEELERLTSGLRDTTTGIRMVQIGTLFSRFRRLTHDLSRELGKPIAFVTAGEETELDKTMIDQIADPLVHLIRNAIDHGLEDTAGRIAAEKDATGTVRLAAAHVSGEIAITLSDDGAGLNAPRIKAKAVDAGLIAADSLLSDDELYPLIFAPGFSTAREVTSLSGRGVGMDVVKRTNDGERGTDDRTTRPAAANTHTLR
jgi:two-component system chemotaxis sensor kinase CheA